MNLLTLIFPFIGNLTPFIELLILNTVSVKLPKEFKLINRPLPDSIFTQHKRFDFQ